MMPGLAMMPGQFSAPNLPEIQQNEPSKLEAPAWGIPDSVQDKQHPVRTFEILQLINSKQNSNKKK